MPDSPYSNKRADLRKAGINTTQRSWSNYMGGNPIKNWNYGAGSSGIGESAPQESQGSSPGPNFYNESPSGTTDALIPPKKPTQLEELQSMTTITPMNTPRAPESQWSKLQRESGLRRGLQEMRKLKPMSGWGGPVV